MIFLTRSTFQRNKSLRVLPAALLFCALPACATVTPDATSVQTAATGTGTSASPITFTHVLGTGSSRLVVCTVNIANPTAAIANVTPTVTFGGVSMIAIPLSQAPGTGQNTSKIETEMFYLNDTGLGAMSGMVNVVATIPAASTGGLVVGCASFFGVTQAAPETAAPAYNGSNTLPPTATVSAANAGDLIVDSLAGGYTVSTTGKTASPNAGQTQLFFAQLSTSGILGGSSFELAAAAGSSSPGWADTASRWAYSAVVFAANANPTYTVTTAVSPAGGGTITLSPNTSTYVSGSSVQVTATPANNYVFTGFTGDLTGTTNPQSLTVNANKSITANFSVAQCTLTMAIVGQGTTTPASGTYNCGSTINLTATPAMGYSFGNWAGTGGYNGTNATASFTLNSNVTETATFVAGSTCNLTTSVNGSGSIAVSPSGGSYTCGTSLQVTATPATNYSFTGFSGALTGTTNPQTFVINSSTSVAAAFTQTSFPVNVTIVGSGTVTASPSAAAYTAGTQVTLTATPSSGYKFNGFTGDLVANSSPQTITVNSTNNITATFAASLITLDSVGHAATTTSTSTLTWQHTLGAGSSRGVVIAVGSSDSSASPDPNAVVSSVLFGGVYATPIPGSVVYTGTSGSVQAQLFYLTDAELPPAGTYTVQVNLVGAVGGTQAGSISVFGINQGPPEAVINHKDGSGADLISTSITTLTNNAWVFDIVEDNNNAVLTANSGQTVAWTQSSTSIGTGGNSYKQVATAGATTLGWAGSASRLVHTLAAFPPVGATVPATYTLTATTTGSGTVTTNPNITQFPTQTGVLLTATPAVGYSFSGWSGDFTSTANPLAIVMDNNHAITANFTSAPTCTLATSIVGSGTVSPSSGTFNCGTVIHFTATPGANYTFTSYSGDFNSTDNPADFTLAANSNVTVEFDAIPYCALNLTTSGTGTVTPASGSYACGSVLTLQATAGSGYGFSGFTGDYTGTNNPATIVLDQPKNIVANFTAGATCTVTTAVSGSGSISPGTGTYACGTTVQVSATPAAHYIFNGFSGDLTGTTTPQPLTLSVNRSVTASFIFNTAGVTGDARTVTEPTYPAVCTVLTALQSVTAPVETSPDTTRIQAALNACPSGKAVEFSSAPGYNAFLIQPITLPAGVTMIIDADVTILASITYADYACNSSTSFCTSVITVAPNTDPSPGSAIMGLGTIDGRGGTTLIGKTTSWWGTGSDARPRLIYLGPSVSSTADNFTMYKVTLRNSPKFHVSGIGNNLTVWGIKIYSPPDSPNTDGVDPSSSKNITITQSYISDGDDMIALKAGNGHVSNVSIYNNHFYTGHGISVGSETNAGLNNMYVHDNAIDNGFGGSSVDSLRIKSDVSRGGEVYDVLYKNTCVNHGGDTLVFDPYYSAKTGTLIPNFHDITLINFHELIRDSSHKVTMQGYNTGGTVYPLTLTMSNVYFDGSTQNDFSAPDQVNNAQFTLGADPVNISSFLMVDAATPANVITVTNNVANSNLAYDCTNAFIYITGDLQAPSGTITAGSSPAITAVIQNVVPPVIAGTLTYPQNHTPTGTINLLEGTTVVGSGTIAGRLATLTVSGITAGTHTYTAQYTGDTNYSAGLAFGSVTLIAANAAPVAASQAVSVAYNTAKGITLVATGAGALTYTVVTLPTHGTLSGVAPSLTYTPTSGYSGADAFTFKANNGADSNIATVSITVAAGSSLTTTTTTLAAPSPSTGLTTGQTTMLSATLAPLTSGGNTATGSITFSDAGTAICSNVAFSPSTGVANCTTSALALGSHSFTAAYSGDANFAMSTSGTQTVTVSGALAMLTVSGFPVAVHIGTPYTVTVTANDSSGAALTGYSGTVTLSSSDANATLPASYTYMPAENGVHTFSVTLNTGGSQTITATSGPVSGFEAGIVVNDFVWLVNSNGTLTKLAETGTTVTPTVGTATTSTATRAAIAFDSFGALWSVNSAANSVVHATNAGSAATTYTGGGLNAPVSIFIGGAGQAWIANTNNTLSLFSNAGAALSPASGYAAATTHVASPLNTPSALAIDNSGAVWVTNSGNGTVTKFFGLAGPVATPTSTSVTNNTLGTKP